MKKKATRQALLMSVLSLMLCVSMLVGTTFAWFTDSVTSDNNIIKSGNLDVELEYWNGEDWVDVTGRSDILTNTLWEPGVTEIAYLRIRNAGTLALKYYLGVNIISESKGVNQDGEEFKLSDSLMFGVVEDIETVEVGTVIAPVEYETREDAVAKLKNAKELSAGYAKAHDLYPENNIPTDVEGAASEKYFALVVYMPTTVGNEANHKTSEDPADPDKYRPEIELGINISATQKDYEYDSFGDDYDVDAFYPASVSKKIGGGGTLEVGGVTVTLPEDAPLAEYTLAVDKLNEEHNDDTNETTVNFNIDLLKDGVKVDPEPGVQYPVSVYMGSKTIKKATHNGEPIDAYTYNPNTGLVSFETDSFSPFSFTYSVFRVSSAEELLTVLSDIKTAAKAVIPGENGNKQFRVDAAIVLDRNIVIDSSTQFMYTDGYGAAFHIYGFNGVIDLNGYTITVTNNALKDGKSYANAALLIQYSNVSIVGEGSIITQNQSIPVYAWANCTVDIYGGTYITNAYERNESAVYVNNASAKVHVYGGDYSDSTYAFNVHDTNCANTPVIVLHEGISYPHFMKNGTTDVIGSDQNGKRIVPADGYALKLEENEDGKIWYVVSADSVEPVE